MFRRIILSNGNYTVIITTLIELLSYIMRNGNTATYGTTGRVCSFLIKQQNISLLLLVC